MKRVIQITAAAALAIGGVAAIVNSTHAAVNSDTCLRCVQGGQCISTLGNGVSSCVFCPGQNCAVT